MKRKSDIVALDPEIKPKRTFTIPSSDETLNKHHIIFEKYLLSKDFNKIQKYFSRFTPDDIKVFFEKKGLGILSGQINIEHLDTDSLDFIFNHVPQESIKNVLSQRNFLILRSFLDISCQMENRGTDNETVRKVRITKFVFMLHFLGQDKVEEILADKNIASNKIREDFYKAKEIYTSKLTRNVQSFKL